MTRYQLAVFFALVSLLLSVSAGFAADDKAIYAYVPQMIRFYLQQDAILPNVETYLLHDPAQRTAHEAAFAAARCDVFASSHTCLPALARFNEGVVINNGAAGMPNFRDALHGVVSRIAVAPSPHSPLYGTRIRGVHVDALPLHYDNARWLDEFDSQWPAGSPAALNYRERILHGPAWTLREAAP